MRRSGVTRCRRGQGTDSRHIARQGSGRRYGRVGPPTPGLQALEARRLCSTYYVAATGNDGADGLSPTTPWQSLARVNRVDLQPGDQVLFQGGATFRSTGGSGLNRVQDPGFSEGLQSWPL